jgi:ligand-binding sensor domain-containing protein
LSVNHIDVVASGLDGAIWVGTLGGGLARFDNGHWQTYTTANTKGGLPSNFITALAPGSDGIWVGTNVGLARLDKDDGWQTYTKAETKGGLPSDGIRALALGSDGALWIGTDGGLARLDKDGLWKTYMTGGVTRLARGGDGAIWIASGGSLTRLDKDGRQQPFNVPNLRDDLPESDFINALAPGLGGVLWIGTFLGGGLARLDKDGRWQTFTQASTNGGLPNDSINALSLGPDGALWIGTRRGGLARLDQDGRWEAYTTMNTNALKNNRIRALAPEPDGAVSIGTFGGGLARLDKDGRWQTYTEANTKGGLPSDFITALAPGSDGALWVGTNGGGLARLDQDGHWRPKNGPEDEIYALAPGLDGTIWVGSGGGGLVRLDKNGRWQTYTKANTKGGLPDNITSALASGSDGAVWVGTLGGGLARLDNGRWQTYTQASTNGGLPSDAIESLALESDGALWVGTNGSGLAHRDKDGLWRISTEANTDGGLPDDRIRALAVGLDGALWVGTDGGGLARRDRDGRWQTYTQPNTNRGLPGDRIESLAPVRDGTLWVGTREGLGHLKRSPVRTHRITEIIGGQGTIAQPEQTMAAIAFDDSYLTQPGMFHYIWRLVEIGLVGGRPAPEISTTSPFYTLKFNHDGSYQLRVVAVDRYGMWSEPQDVDLRVTLPKPDPYREMLMQLATALTSAGLLYFALLFPLIPLYPHLAWARTATNSGLFTKFPVLHKAVLNTRWARGHLFRRLAESAQSGVGIPSPYIPQSLFAARDRTPNPVVCDGSDASLMQLFDGPRRALLIARSGTGKSVLLRHLLREVAARFLRGKRVPLPVLIDLRTHVLSGRAVKDLIRDALRGGGVELTDGDIDFLVGKGGFLILVDSLNELPNRADASLFHTFFNQDAKNEILIASQLDLIRRDDTRIFNLAEVTAEQAAKYLAGATGTDLYPSLPLEAKALARSPQDLALLVEVICSLGTAHVPTHRAELYRAILEQDGALRDWVARRDQRLAVIYALAFRMVLQHRVLQEYQLREWIAAALNEGDSDVASIVQALQASRLFRNEVQRDVLGKQQPVTGFSHELIGKFLAARHLRRAITQGGGRTVVDYVALSADELWLDAFYFVIDEIDSPEVLNRFLMEILVV